MLRPIKFVSSYLIVAALLSAGQAFSAIRLEPLTIGYSNITATYAPLWVAVEERVGMRYGLDLKAIYAGRVRPQQLLATGDVPVVIASGTGPMTSQDAPYPSLQVVKAGLEMLSLQYPQAKQTDASLIIEPTFIKWIDDSGFVWALYKN